ncbi:hypothetical protein ACFVMC_23285 [Nocardia sp. NPDC127579]|uniref:hypothetical protein n=1 Tax=Nocardia sp. NPDC127579 TaxID=3345402 RepID=UPI003628FD6E
MRLSRFAVAAVLAVAAHGLVGGAAQAEPPSEMAVDSTPLHLRGSFQEVAYEVGVAPDRRSTVTTLQHGRFALIADNKVVTVADDAGRVIAALPTVVDIEGRKVDLAPVVDEAGTRLTLAPPNQSGTPVREIGAQERFFADLERYQPQVMQGAAIGAAIGFLAGFPLGLFVFDIVTVPIATVVGAVIGGFVGLHQAGGQESIDAAIAYVTGQP